MSELNKKQKDCIQMNDQTGNAGKSSVDLFKDESTPILRNTPGIAGGVEVPELKTSLVFNDDSEGEDITTERLLNDHEKEEIKRAVFENAQQSIIDGSSDSYSSVEEDEQPPKKQYTAIEAEILAKYVQHEKKEETK